MKHASKPQIEITKEVNPGVTIQVGTRSTLIESATVGTFELVDGVLNS